MTGTRHNKTSLKTVNVPKVNQTDHQDKLVKIALIPEVVTINAINTQFC